MPEFQPEEPPPRPIPEILADMGLEGTFSGSHVKPATVEHRPGECLFCQDGFSSGRTKEHVFPRWLLGHLGVSATEMRGRWMEGATLYQTTKNIRQQSLGSMVHGHVCAGCNGGWMSALEVEVRPVLVGLADGTRDVRTLTTRARELLARWTVKTVAALNHASNFHTMVPYEHARAVRTGVPVIGTTVFARQMPRVHDRISWHQCSLGPGIIPRGASSAEAMAAMSGEWRIALAVDRLLVGAFFMPTSDYVHCAERTLHVPVWPVGGTWPVTDRTSGFPLDDVAAELSAFTYFELFWIHESLREDHDEVSLPA